MDEKAHPGRLGQVALMRSLSNSEARARTGTSMHVHEHEIVVRGVAWL
jgi:hypothetical protein